MLSTCRGCLLGAAGNVHHQRLETDLQVQLIIIIIIITSTPVVRTGVDPHMPIAFTANSLQHWLSPSKRRPVSHRSATVGQVCCTGLTSVERVIDFSIFELGGLPLGPRSPKVEMTYYPPRSTILQNFSPIAQTVYEICVTKVFHFLAPGGLTPAPKFTKRGMTWWTPRSTTLQNFIALCQPTPEISVTKIPADTQKTNKQ